MSDGKRLQELIPFLQQQGFVWGPEPEIYGGMSGMYTYGPLGTLLKRNVEKEIRKTFSKWQFFEVETPTVLPKAVWEASGHLGGFTDPLIRDTKGNIFRADKLLEDHYQENNINEPVPVKADELIEALKKHQLKAPSGEAFVYEIHNHSLMMKTTIGTEHEAYNRPETATATYLPFLRYTEFFRKRLPFGIFQIGKAYRNEISPRKHLLRLREFTQAEAQIFIDPSLKDEYAPYHTIKKDSLPLFSWDDQVAGKQPVDMTVEEARKSLFSSNAYAFTVHLAYTVFVRFGIPKERIRIRQHGDDEKAHYAADAWDIEINVPTFGWTEVCGVHDRADYDLSQHEKHSKKDMKVFVESSKQHVTPHVLEIAFGVDRPVFALLDVYYNQKSANEGKTTFTIPKKLAPVQVTVLPLQKKLSEKGLEVFDMLIDAGFITTFDESGSIGKRYLRSSTIGTPYCVTIDFDTLDDNTVTVRDRDTEEQFRVNIDDLAAKLTQLLG